jgi:uncharacterized protein (TIGR02246 family)
MPSEVTELARESMRVWNSHDLDGYLSFFAADATYVGPRRRVGGIAAIRAYMTMLMEAFPDESVIVDRVASDGDTAFVRYTDSATHAGVMRWSAHRQIPPTGRRFTYDGVTELRFVDGKIVYARDYFDLYDLLFIQLGFPLPTPAAAASSSTSEVTGAE